MMYVVTWAFKDGDYYSGTNEDTIKTAEEVIIFLDAALELIADLKADPDTISVALYECHKIEIPSKIS